MILRFHYFQPSLGSSVVAMVEAVVVATVVTAAVATVAVAAVVSVKMAAVMYTMRCTITHANSKCRHPIP
jgi:hypothetical protein